MSGPLTMLWWLLVGHALCDYPLQGDFLARGKNHTLPMHFGIPWVHCLTAHALIQAGMVALATGRVSLGVAEFVAHWLIDYGKSDKRFGIHTDQALHILCKLAWVAIAFGWLA
jgi:hypothetical protein